MVQVCSTLACGEELERDIIVKLNTSDSTGLYSSLCTMYDFQPHFKIALNQFDYTGINSYLTFNSGSTNNSIRCLNISIYDDNALEGNQIFTVMLSTTDPDVVLGNFLLTVIITDDDGQLSYHNFTFFHDGKMN